MHAKRMNWMLSNTIWMSLILKLTVLANNGLNPLDMAALHGALHVVKYMVEDKHCAVTHAKFSHKSVVKRLIVKYGCYQYIMDKMNKIPLDYTKNENIAHYLSHVDDIAKGKYSLTALVYQFHKHYHFSRFPTGNSTGGPESAYQASQANWCKIGKGTVWIGYSTAAGWRNNSWKGIQVGQISVVRSSEKKLHYEIRMVLHLKHPNIVSSKGVCFLPDFALPVLLMEQLMSTLHDYIIDHSHFELSMKKRSPSRMMWLNA